jgi:putative aldouronate transport system substrate-binding protein
LLEDNEVYYRGLKFFYQLNKNGLLEPDGITQTKATSDAKIKSGAYLATGFAGYTATFNTKDRMNAGIGYRPVIFDEYVSSTLGDYPVGSGSYFTISKNSKKLDASLKFLDLISNPDTLLTIWNGPKGEFWDIDSSGKLIAKDAYYNYLSTGKHKLSSGADYVSYGNPFILRVETINPKYNKTISMGYWPEVLEKINDNALYKSWSDNYGYKFPIDLLEAQNRIAKRPLGYQSFLPAIPNDLMLTRNAVTNIIVTNSWKMIYAKDDNEFNRLWKETKDQVNALGYQDVVKWAKESIAKADADAKPYIK